MQPPDLILSKAKEKVIAQPTLDVKPKISSGFEVDIDYPLVVLYSEKTEMEPVFQELAERYLIAYYIGSGYISITGIKQIYDYIKKHSKYAIILTLTDHDPDGMNMPIVLTRNLQMLLESDKTDPPKVVVFPWLIDNDTVIKLQTAGVSPVVRKISERGVLAREKTERTSNYFLIWELAALEVLAVRENKTLSEYLAGELSQKVTLLDRGNVDAHITEEHKKFRKAISSVLNTKLAAKQSDPFLLDFQNLIGSPNILEEYEQRLGSQISSMTPVQLLKDSLTETKFEVTPISLDEAPLNIFHIPLDDPLVLINPMVQEDYEEVTHMLNDAKKRIESFELDPAKAVDINNEQIMDVLLTRGKQIRTLRDELREKEAIPTPEPTKGPEYTSLAKFRKYCKEHKLNAAQCAHEWKNYQKTGELPK